MSNNILSIGALAMHDDSIIKKELYPYTPFTQALGESDEIRIAIQSQDTFLLPSESYIYMQVAVTTNGVVGADDAEIHFVNNFGSYLFSEIRYEINNHEVDRVRNLGRSTTMKLRIAARSNLAGYQSYCKGMENTVATTAAERLFDVTIPLSAWMGFADFYRKIILNCKHELILNRARQSLDCTSGGVATAAGAFVSVSLRKIVWRMMHITLEDSVKLKMMNYLSNNRKITMQYRSMEMLEFPVLPQTTSTLWSVKTISSVNRPRFVIVGFQTNRNGVRVRDASFFDACNMSELRLHMNSQIYPYNASEIDIGNARYSELYHSTANIQSSYYNNTEATNPFALSFREMQDCALFAFDTSHAEETLIDSAVDIKIEIKTRQNIPANTTGLCLIVYDREIQYSPFEGHITRSI